jgi:S1-C subfamily serine protease
MSRSWFLPPVSFALVLLGALAAQPGQESPPRGFLGIGVAPEPQTDKGILVQDVTPNSPAAKAGLKSGDVIVKWNGKPVPEVKEFLRGIAAQKPGDKVELQVLRDGKEQTLTATLAERPAAGGVPPIAPPGIGGGAPGLRRPAYLGVGVEALTPELTKKLGVKAESGVVVTEVLPKSPAAKAGLQTDDVITAVDAQPVRDPDDLRTAVRQAGAGKDITLKIVRGKEEKTVKASLQEGPGGFAPLPDGRFPEIEPLLDQSAKIRDLERRIEELRKRLEALEKQQGPPNKK